LETLEDRRLLSIDLLSGVSNPLILGTSATGRSEATSFALSDDARFVAFESAAANLIPGDTSGYRDVFLRDRQTQAVTLLSTDSLGIPGNGDSEKPALAGEGRYVAFSSSATNLVAGDTNAAADIFAKDLLSGVTTRVSTDIADAETNGASSQPAISSDGRYVVFTSLATNLVSGDTNGCSDVFLKDRLTGAMRRISTDSAGVQGNGDSSEGMISADGRYVAFTSLSSNLTGSDLNAAADIFVKDLLTGTTSRVSTASAGTAANGESYHPSISGDGRYVTFASDATNLVGGDTNFVTDIFVKDRQTDVTTRVSTTSAGGQATELSGTPSVSVDGRYVIFRSDAPDLVAGDLNLAADVFVRDLVAGTTTRVSTSAAGLEADDESVHPAISADGRYVMFNSDAGNLVTGDVNGLRDVYVKDLQTGSLSLMSMRDTGVAGPFAAGGYSHEPALSGDGRYVAFSSAAANLVSGDTNNDRDIFFADRLSGILQRISTDSGGGQGNDDSDAPDVSRNGRFVVFHSASDDLVDGDTNGYLDVFLKDLHTGVVTLVSTNDTGAGTNGDSVDPVVSDDGRYVAFTSSASNLVANDRNLCEDVFVKDLLTGSVTRVSTNGAGVEGGDISASPAMTGDGRYVVFESDAANLVTGDTNNDTDVFRRDLSTGTIIRVSTASSSAQGDDNSTHASITDDGRYVVFSSDATNLVSNDTNAVQDVFLKDLQTGLTSRLSTSGVGAQANADSASPEICADGRYVIFRSLASNLVFGGDSNQQDDIYLKDRQTGITTRLSGPVAGVEPNNDSFHPALSADGSYAAFASDASNLFTGDGNELTDVFLVAVGAANAAPTEIILSAASLQENSALGTVVGFLRTTDPDIGDTFVYELASGLGDTDNDMFTIVGDELRTAAAFNYEAGSAYSVRIRTTDAGGLSCEQSFAITVSDVNETPTEILVSGALSIPENAAAGVVVCSLATIDPDAGGSHSYSLRDDAGGRFAIQGTEVVVASGATFDFETNASHVIRVRSTDQGGLWLDKAVTVTVTNVNETPTDIPVATPITVLEFSPTDTLVCTLATTDPDAGDTHVYSLLDDAGGRFALDGDRLVVADGSLLDYQASTSHVIRVRTTDQGGLPYAKELTVLVTNVNQAPTGIQASEPIAVAEGSSPGTAVCSLTTIDPDAGDQFTYTLVDDAGGRFAVQGAKVVVADGTLIDYETATRHGIKVRTTDRGGLWYEKQFTVQVLDVEEPLPVTTPGLYNPAASIFSLICENTSGPADYTFGYGEGNKGWKVLVGDWTGDGTAGVGLYAPESSTFYLTSAYSWGYAEYTFGYGEPNKGWIPLVGDWNGDGKAGVGLYDPNSSTFYLTDSLESGFAQYTFGYGEPGKGWMPIVGDWNGDGSTGVGLYNPHASTFYLTNALKSGFAEHTFGYGEAEKGWQPLLGDWNGDGSTGVGLYDPHASTFYLTNAFVSGFAEHTFGYGVPNDGWKPLVGDWDGDAADGVGLYAPGDSVFYLTNQLSTGIAEYEVHFGQAGANFEPIVGHWKPLGASATSTVAISAPATSLNAAAVDQVDLADLAAKELQLPTALSDDGADS
jgi:Tol biopolymer transport system component